jgi:Sulfotransferase domain
MPWPSSHRHYVFVTHHSRLLFDWLIFSTISALYTALNVLGYQCYHYLEIRNNQKHAHIRCWLEAMNAKVYGVGKAYGRDKFDKVLAKYNVGGWGC